MKIQDTPHKKWYKKIRYWILMVILLIIIAFTIVSISISGDPMFVSPPQKVQEQKISLKGINADNGAEVKIYLNGNVVSELKADSNGKFNAELELFEGKNDIYAEGTTSGNTKRGISYTITYEPKAQEVAKAEVKPEEVAKGKQETPQEETKKEEITNPVRRIQAIIKSTTEKSEITIWDTKGNFAKETTEPPYEVIINAGKGDITSCYYAKNVAFEIMKKLYSDAMVKDKISRVLFTSWGHLRVSVGSEDGIKTNWAISGPTNFWTVMMQYKPYEDETGLLNQRTWGKEISSDCDK